MFDDEDLDSITSSRAIHNSTSLLLELSKEIRSASATKGYPPKKLRRMIKGFKRLEEFSSKALRLHKEKFGGLGEDLESRQKEVENNVIPLRRGAM